jgi:tetratricopeptide (TPR) repeat protein
MADWGAWFGVKLAQMITLTDTWQPSDGLGALQLMLDQEVTMSDAVIPGTGETGAMYAPSRRQALLTLAALPAAAAGAWPAGDADGPFLARCAASLTACWHLLRGSDLGAVEQMMTGYLLPLEAAASKYGRDRQAAAMLTAQAHRICGIISMHRQQLGVREQHCRRALRFAESAGDLSSHASALISLASTYFYTGDLGAAAALFEQASAHGAALPQLLQSRVHAELAVIYGQFGREKDSIRAIGQSGELYPDQPENDPSYLYAEFTRGSLALEQGLAWQALAGQFPGRGYSRKAHTVFAEILVSGAVLPERIRCEITGQQAATAVIAGDLDAFERYFRDGLDGAVALASRQRMRELATIWQQAAQRWPGDRRLRELGDRLHDTTAVRAALHE